jgi:hypothetical protein
MTAHAQREGRRVTGGSGRCSRRVRELLGVKLLL